ncbi:putative aminohydrolase SsnA [Candidatus Uabimicrobium sp. HlEnr_7]|uniref:putative aminohydrolase SsnA n=1 Tax=Candidatus Uabimicrobium helgolandensis TaxID=3095367 RepID=UPI003557E95C
MNEYLITNGTIVTLGESNDVISQGVVYIKDGKIADFGDKSLVEKYNCPVGIDAKNKVIMPGFICAHHHLYSTMARGFAPPGEPAYTFQEVLERLWWKLDAALGVEDVYYSALVPMIECIRNGTTTIIDHHASPKCADGSLDQIANAVLESGIRACLCYEVSDRNKLGEGLAENARFLERVQSENSPFLTAMLGMHASFTIGNDTLHKCKEIAEKYNVGYHIHVCEGPEDGVDSQKKYGMTPIERLIREGICGEKSIFAHCIHIDDQQIELLRDSKTIVLHNPESNMNNAVGVTPILKMMSQGIVVGMGTDGMSSDMLSQMRCAYLLHRLANKDPRVAFTEAPQMLLNNNPLIAERFFSQRLGVIEKNAPADLAILDYIPPTNMCKNNFLGHFIFGMVDAVVDTTIASGKILMKNKKILHLDEEKIAARSRELAAKLHQRII